MPTRSSIPNMPGWVWVYPGERPNHGFAGRHSYNPMTGESLSLRHTQAVRDGNESLAAALNRTMVPRTTHTITRGPHSYIIRNFDTIYGAVRYASLRGPRDGFMHIIALGTVKEWKPESGDNADGTGYRWITDFGTRSFFASDAALTDAYTRFDQQFTSASRSGGYFLWEQV